MKSFLNFISYNNAFPIALGFLFLSVGGAMAASPELRDGIVSSSQSIRSVDNSYILAADLSNYSPKVSITGVTEDSDFYYVEYLFSTIGLAEGSWRDVQDSRTMKVAKADLGSKDLGVYVTKELSEVIDSELSRLKETQIFERQRGVTQEVVATEYSGLIGKFLDDKIETLPGYVPVRAEPVQSDSVAAATQAIQNTSQSSVQSPASSGGGLAITVLGNNPARIQLRSSYIDLGAVVVNSNVGISYTVDGKAVPEVTIDTTVVGEHKITYSASDQNGNTGYAERTVIVYDPSAPPESTVGTASSTPETGEASSATTTAATSTPANPGEGATSTQEAL